MKVYVSNYSGGMQLRAYCNVIEAFFVDPNAFKIEFGGLYTDSEVVNEIETYKFAIPREQYLCHLCASNSYESHFIFTEIRTRVTRGCV